METHIKLSRCICHSIPTNSKDTRDLTYKLTIIFLQDVITGNAALRILLVISINVSQSTIEKFDYQTYKNDTKLQLEGIRNGFKLKQRKCLYEIAIGNILNWAKIYYSFYILNQMSYKISRRHLCSKGLLYQSLI